ncbi:MAG: ribokinase, partial [Planctomycetes bacterium]|nr:ribokinase [Planctomycetota bacterium]
AGQIGSDGTWLRKLLAAEGVDVRVLQMTSDAPTGHAIIQVTASGENSILIHGGANQTLDESFVKRAFDAIEDVDMVVLQNETSAVRHVLSVAQQRGLPVVFNPAPMTKGVMKLPLGTLAILIVNEVEAGGLVGAGDPETLCRRLAERFPTTLCVLTVGERGAWAARGSERWHDPGRPVQAVDTTAAGDTFIGFFLAELLRSESVCHALAMGNQAAAISVTRRGAADSIPTREQIVLD